MNEPTYEYIKGKGWVLVPPNCSVFTMACGTVVRIEPRPPNPGDYFSWIFDDGKETDWQTVNGEPKLPSFVDYYRTLRFYESLNEYAGNGIYKNRIYITFIRIN